MSRSNLRDQQKGMTRIHRFLSATISGLGFHVENEYPFPPYQVDAYVPEAHVAFEADGISHLVKEDAIRDENLFEVYGLLVKRFPAKELTKKNLTVLEDAIIAFIDESAPSGKERKSGRI